MTRQNVFAACFFAVLVALLYQIGVIFRPFLLPVLWAGILAHVTFPLQTRLTAAFNGRETTAALTLTLGIIAVVIVPMVYLALLLIQEAGSAYEAVNAWVQSGGVKRLPAQFPQGGLFQEFLGRIVVSQGNIETFLLQSSRTISGFLVEQFTDLAKNIFVLAVHFLVMIVTLFFFLREGHRLYELAYSLTPLEEGHKEKIFSRLDQTITAVVKGIVITAIVQGLLAGIAYGILGAPVPVFLMALTILLAPLPLGGTALVWGPVAIYLFVSAPIWKGIAMLVWGAGVVTTVDNVLRPLLIGHGAKLPVLLLFFSIIGGLGAYGFIGLFLGPILLAILLTVIQIYREDYMTKPVPPPIVSDRPPAA